MLYLTYLVGRMFLEQKKKLDKVKHKIGFNFFFNNLFFS